jgi:hypothetical protein
MVLALESDRPIHYSYMDYINGEIVEEVRIVKCTDIMISIMLSSNYTPFVKNVKPILCESPMGVSYGLDCPISLDQFENLITGYAKQFINDNK